METKLNKEELWDFIILSLRWYLAVYMFDYGFTKIFGGQFHVDTKILEQPVKDVNRFYLAWYLFSSSKFFNIAVGISQIAGALLVIFNRTTVIGALLLLPVLINIFLVDVTFTTGMFGVALPLRLGMMTISDLAILFYYRNILYQAWQILTGSSLANRAYSWWVYPLLFLIGFSLDFVFAVLTWPIKMLFHLL